MGTAIDHTIAKEIAASLLATPRFIPAKYHYDTKGSTLFEDITELHEYYLTRCERIILENFKKEITGLITNGVTVNIIELGAGDGHKTIPLLEELIAKNKPFTYLPIDVSEAALRKLEDTLKTEYAHSCMQVKGIVADYISGLQQIDPQTRHLILFLGSSIGNFNSGEAQQFLVNLRSFVKKQDVLLIGFDLKKDVDVLQRAYKDSKGVTSEFNLNVLDRLNREIGTNFDRSKFEFHCFYNVLEGRVESWLVSKEKQTVTISSLQKSFTLQPWEGIHMENSYKYNLRDIEELVHGAGYSIEKIFSDPQQYFACVALRLRS